MDLELRHLRALVVLAEELNFTRAAGRLHLSQQALSAQIRQLEERVGTQLVERDTRRVALTAAGAELCEHARPLLAGAEKAVSAARAAGGKSPVLTLGVRAAAALRLVGPALELFAERHLDVELRFRFGDFDDSSGGLRGGEADVAIVAGPFESDGLELRSLFSEPRGAWLAADHPLAARSEVSLEDLLAEPMVDVPTRDQVWRDFWYVNAHRGGRPPRFAATAQSHDGELEAVRAGIAVAAAMESVVRLLGPESGIVFRPVPGLEPVEFSVGRRVDDDRAEVLDFVDAAVTALAGRESLASG